MVQDRRSTMYWSKQVRCDFNMLHVCSLENELAVVILWFLSIWFTCICLRLYKWSETMVSCPIAWKVYLPTPRWTNRHVLFFLWPQSVSRLDNNGIQLQPVQHNTSLFSYVIYRAIKNYIIPWQNIGFNGLL